MAGELQLTPVNRFCYLGSYLSNTISVDIDVNSRLAKAGDAFGKLQRRLWGEHSVALLTKIAVYQAVVLSTCCTGVNPGSCTGVQFAGWMSSTRDACAKQPVSNGKTEC